MLLEPTAFREAFLGAVRNDALDNEVQKALLVFVSSAEADSVCAIRILQVRLSMVACAWLYSSSERTLIPSKTPHVISSPMNASESSRGR